jgi:HAD superfamily phosphoserine phosphatase-like hydrolase
MGIYSNNLVIFDIDGTLTREQSIWQYLMEQTHCWSGQGEDNLAKFLRGDVDYYEFCQMDARLFKGRRYEGLKRLAHAIPKYDGLDAVFSYFATREFQIALVSTGLRLVADYFTSLYPIDFYVVNDLAHDGVLCNGEAIINITDNEKDIVALDLMRRCHTKNLVAFGDSREEIPIFKLANFNIAVNANNAELLSPATYQHNGPDLSTCLEKLVRCKYSVHTNHMII